MPNRFRVGLVGARGYVGQELLRLIAAHPRLELGFATSREKGGSPVEGFEHLAYEELSPENAAERKVDAVILGLPNGLSYPFVEAIGDRCVLVDLSTDHREAEGWQYRVADLAAPHQPVGRRIANPGCYATAANLGLYPIRDLIADTPVVVGISGFSGAGTVPSPRNDPAVLAGNIVPYAYEGHAHQAEISRFIGRDVRFLPHVAQFFRGLVASVSVPVVSGARVQDVTGRWQARYADAATVRLSRDLPDVRQAAGTDHAVIGGPAIDRGTDVLSFAVAIDNLLKGAASQAVANLEASLGLPTKRVH